MRTITIIACLLFLPLFSGCTIAEGIFAVLGEKHYTGGGYTRAEKEYHFNQQIERSRSYGSLYGEL